MRRLAVLVVGALVALSGCSPTGSPAPEPFGELTFTRTGGVAGLRDRLHVRPDGVAVLTGTQVRAGRLDADRMDRVRALATSARLAAEAEAPRPSDQSSRCSDLISRSVTMGSLRVVVTEACGRGGGPATPAFDELFGLVADVLRGRFDEPLRPGDAPRLSLRTEQTDAGRTRPYVVELAPGGDVRLTRPGADPVVRRVGEDEREALALVGAALLGQATGPCGNPPPWSVTVTASDGHTVTGSGCAFGVRGADAWALHLALGRVFDLV